MKFRRHLLQVFALLISLVMVAKAAEDVAGHDHHEGQKCAECAALPGGRRKYVPVSQLSVEIQARPLLEHKLSEAFETTPIESAQQAETVHAFLHEAPSAVHSPRAPPSKASAPDHQTPATEPDFGSSAPRAPPAS